MLRATCVWLWVLVGFGCLSPMMAAVVAAGDGEDVKSAIRAAEGSVVRVRVIGGQQEIDGESVNSLVTTGVVISESGEILTSAFATSGTPDAVFAERADGSRVGAKIIATDHVRRLVLLKVDGGGQWQPVRAVKKGEVRVGQYAIALGRFYSASSVSVSVGIVSALNRIHGRALQSDAKISPVNYGGPLIGLSGEALGLLVPLSPRGRGGAGSGLEWYDSGIGFAIPMEDALESAARLRGGADLRPGLLGVRLEDTGAFSSRVVVADVVAGGPAAESGLQAGDRILSLAGRQMERPGLVEEALAARYAGDVVEVVYERGGAELKASVTLAAELPAREPGIWGLLPVPSAGGPGGGGGGGGEDLLQRMLRREGAGGNGAEAGEAEKDKPPALPLRVLALPGLPAAEAGLPAVVDILAVDGVKVVTEGELRRRLGSGGAGVSVKLTWKAPGAEAEQQTEVRAVARGVRLVAFPAGVVEQLETAAVELAALNAAAAGAAAAGEGEKAVEAGGQGVSRREIEVPEKGRLVVLQSGEKTSLPTAPVMLLSAAGISEEQLLAEWGPLLGPQRLTLIVPMNPEGTPLTDADGALVARGLSAAAGELKCDMRRAVLVAGAGQSELAWQLASDPAVPIRGIALQGGWISESQLEGGVQAGPAVLFMAAPGLSAQESALRARSVEQLRRQGLWVPEQETAGEGVELIGGWSWWVRGV